MERLGFGSEDPESSQPPCQSPFSGSKWNRTDGVPGPVTFCRIRGCASPGIMKPTISHKLEEIVCILTPRKQFKKKLAFDTYRSGPRNSLHSGSSFYWYLLIAYCQGPFRVLSFVSKETKQRARHLVYSHLVLALENVTFLFSISM